MHPKRKEIAADILTALESKKELLKNFYNDSGKIGYFYLDELLPTELALDIRVSFPDPSLMRIKKSLRELKFIGAQMDQYNPLLEEVIYAFQDPTIVSAISEITGIEHLEPDEMLYAGGVSMMKKDHFLNPHLDNSHDKNVDRYRVLNLLYYVSPNWGLNSGGNLELWPNGPEGHPIAIESKFNRLVVMATNRYSWHSVSKVRSDDCRCCISNYYFSKHSINNENYFHVTSFRGRPEQAIRDLVLRMDIKIRMLIRRVFKKGISQTGHYYDKKDD